MIWLAALLFLFVGCPALLLFAACAVGSSQANERFRAATEGTVGIDGHLPHFKHCGRERPRVVRPNYGRVRL